MIYLDITIRAGDAIMDIYSKDFEVEIKEDNSPLTQADRSSHKIIDNGLSSYNLPILSEEGRDEFHIMRGKTGLYFG